MKKAKTHQPSGEDMLPEYDFSDRKGVRGKYHRACRDGYTVRVHKADGTVSVRHFTFGEGAVILDPEVRDYFPDSEAVNAALRGLISLIPRKRKAAPTKRARRAATPA